MKKWVVILISIVLFFAILFGGSAIFENFKPKPKTSGFYYNGLFLYYHLHWETGTYNGIVNGSGVLILKVIENTININVTIPDFYPSHATLYRDVNLTLNGDNITYQGEPVILPFFYGGGKIVSYYDGNYINVTGKLESPADVNLNGILKYQAVYYMDTYSYFHFPNGTVWFKGNNPADYVYGRNTNVLFVLWTIGWDPVIDFLLNLTYPAKMPDGSVFYTPVDFSIYLEKTNLNLGPINYFAVIIMYIGYVIFIASPIIIFIGIPLIIIGIYRAIKKRRSSNG